MVIGVFSDRGIEKLVQDGNISSSTKITPEQIQPSSIDLTVGNIGFCLKYSSIPDGTNLKEYFSRVKNYQISPENGVHMHKDQIYVVKLNERLNFKNNPTPILARANPKSSTGRTDIQVRLITESGKEFDNVPENYSGDLWLEIVPRSFDIYLKSGIALNQLRIFNQSLSPLSYSELELAHSETGLIFKKGRKEKLNFSSEKVIQVSVDLSRKLGAYVARSDCTSVVDLTRKDNKTSEFFREVYTEDNSIILIPNRFYILSSTEEINIPLECCGEMGDIQTSMENSEHIMQDSSTQGLVQQQY
jgi:dCTP deaminase